MTNDREEGAGQGMANGNLLYDVLKGPLVVVGIVAAIGVLYWLGPLQRWAYIAIVILAVLLVAGRYGTTIGRLQKKWSAALIDPQRGKYSLGQLQLVAWTIVVLSAWLAIVATRILLQVPSAEVVQNSVTTITELEQELNSAASPEAKQELQKRIDEEKQKLAKLLAADVTFEDALNVDIPGDVLILWGISATSLVAGVTIKGEKRKPGKAGFVALDIANIENVKEQKPAELSWLDLFKGDQQADKDYIDIGKFQMFWFTVAALVAYGMQIYASIHAATTSETLKALVGQEYLMKAGFALITSLPAVSASLAVVLGLSHAAYLANKIPERQPAANP